MTHNSSLRAKIFIILLVMAEILAMVLSVAMAFNYQDAIKSYYGNVADKICNQIEDYIDIDKLKLDIKNEEVTDDLLNIKNMLKDFVKHYSLHSINIFILNDNFVKYIIDTNKDEYFEMNFDRLTIEQNKIDNIDKKMINISEIVEMYETKSNDDILEEKKLNVMTIASYVEEIRENQDKQDDTYIYLNIDFIVDVIHNQIRDFVIAVISFCTIALILEGLILFIYLKFLVVEPLNQFSKILNQIETDKDIRNLDLSNININSLEINSFKKEVSNVINKFNQYSELLSESIMENRKSQYAIKTLSKFAEERGLPTSFYDDKNDYYTICGMLDTVNNRVTKNFYDSFMVDKNRLCIIVFQNNQDSMASLLFMDMLRERIKKDTLQGMNIADIFTNISKFMLNIEWVGITVNAYQAIINLYNGNVEYVVAGDIYQSILVDKGIYKKFVSLPLSNMPNFSVKASAIYKTNQLTLLPNEKLIIYTSDIKNIFSLDSGRFGEELLLQSLNEKINETTVKLYNSLIDEIIKIRNEKNAEDIDSAFLLIDIKKYMGDKDVDLS